MSDHACQCFVCHPEAFPTIPDVEDCWGQALHPYIAADNHQVEYLRPVPAYATEYGGAEHRRLFVTVNGARPGGVYEAKCGVVGWVIHQRGAVGWPHGPGTSHPCSCGSGSRCLTVTWGNVELHRAGDYGRDMGRAS